MTNTDTSQDHATIFFDNTVGEVYSIEEDKDNDNLVVRNPFTGETVETLDEAEFDDIKREGEMIQVDDNVINDPTEHVLKKLDDLQNRDSDHRETYVSGTEFASIEFLKEFIAHQNMEIDELYFSKYIEE
jgi:hypothetical protein